MLKTIRNWKNRGASLKTINMAMGGIVAVLAVLLMISIYRSSFGFEALRAVTRQHAELRVSSYELQIASDYLTEQVRCYTESGNREYLDHYFEEANVTRRRDRALEILQGELGDTVPYQALQAAMNQSVHLMDREYHAMRLTIESRHVDVTLFPDQIQRVELSGEEKGLSDAEKEALARNMVFDDEYHHQKEIISENMQTCLRDLDDIMHGREEEASASMDGILWQQRILIILLIICILALVILNVNLMIQPLLQAVNEIRGDRPISVHGAWELRYLAHTYNLAYGNNLQNTERLAYEASHDKLTGLRNRSSFDFFMENMKMEESALILIDVDHFKEINDSQGHDTGDQALCAVAEVLRSSFRSQDYIFRIGGDEFAVILLRINRSYTEMIRRKISLINRKLEEQEDERFRSSVSAGVAFSEGSKEPKTLFRQADRALYQVKKSGRRGCSFHRERNA